MEFTMVDISGKEWRSVSECAGYWASRDGAVMKVDENGASRLLRKYGSNRRIRLAENSRPKTIGVSALVALCFIGKRPHGCKIIRLDFNNYNDAADNLAYANPEQYRAYIRELFRHRGKR